MNRWLVAAACLLAGGTLKAQADSLGKIEEDAAAVLADADGSIGHGRKLEELVDRCFELAAKHPGKDEAFDACAFALKIVGGVDEDRKIAAIKEAMRTLTAGFAQSPRIAEVVIGPLRKLYADLELEVGEQITALEKATTNDSVRCACIFVRTAQELGDLPSAKERKAAATVYGDLIAKYGGLDLPGSKSRKWRELLQYEIDALTTYAVGGTPPDVAGVDLDGAPLKLSEFRGRVVLVDFWAFWSATSCDLLAHERVMVERLKEQPFALVGVNQDEDLATDRAQQLADAKLTWRSFKNAATTPSIAERWCVRTWPTLFLLDAQGKIRKKWSGSPDYRALDREIDELLAEVAGKAAKEAKPAPAPPPKKKG